MAKKVLFMGDSITNSGRDLEKNPRHLGYGYPNMVGGVLSIDEPGDYEFVNRGIGGNRIVDIYARIRIDMINLQPDYMSILVGINDVLHEYDYQNGVDAEKYEKIYGMLIEELLDALPNLKIMIMEPFVLPGRLTSTDEAHPGRWEHFVKEAPLRAQAAKRIAEKYHLKFVPLQEQFNAAAAGMPENYLVLDGIHPTMAGHELIKRAWLKAFREL